MNDEEFEELVETYRAFTRDDISREDAEEEIGEHWESVAQVASMKQARDNQEPIEDEDEDEDVARMLDDEAEAIERRVFRGDSETIPAEELLEEHFNDESGEDL